MFTQRILVLDIDADVGLTIQRMLETEGHRVHVVATPAAAYTALSREHFDVVFTNRLSGAFSSADSLPWMLRAIQPQVGIVLTTPGPDVGDDCVPFDAILRKPFSIGQAREAIQAAICTKLSGDTGHSSLGSEC